METVLPSAYRDGKDMVVPRGSVLPANCVKCAATAEKPWNKEFRWHAPWLYFLIIFPGLLIYAIVALIIQKKIKLAVPLCDIHHSERKRYLMIGLILLFGCIPFGMFLSMGLNLDEAIGWLAGVVSFFAGVIFCSISGNIIRPKLIDEQKAVFTGCHQDFLTLLPDKPLFM